jgi:uncharacterized protein YceK
MKNVIGAGLVLVIALLSGCATLSDATSGVREAMAERDQPRTHSYEADQRTTYQAVRIAAEKMGYRFLKGGAAQGRLEAVGSVGAGESNRSSRQIMMRVDLKPAEDKTEVRVRLTEVIESESGSRSVTTTESPLRGTPQYEVFFRAVQQVLEEQGAVKAPGK